MAEQQSTYQTAMNEAASAAWDQDWQTAARSYGRALQSKPDDPQALAGLALALLESGQYDKALPTYDRVSKLVPGDPLPYEKMGEIYERKGSRQEAAKQYHTAADTYFARKDSERAVPLWEKAIGLDIDMAPAHMRLAVAYEAKEETHPHAVLEYLHVARILQHLGQTPRAEQALNRALQLDPISPDTRAALDDMRRGHPIQIAMTYADLARPRREPMARQEPEEDVWDEEEPARTLIEDAAREALGLLADIVWTGEMLPEAQVPLVQAIDNHQVGDAESALKNYARALHAGMEHPALRFNMAVLYQFDHQPDKVIEVLSEPIGSDSYAAASHLLLTQAHLEQGNWLPAAENAIQALRAADKTLNPGEVDEGGYERTLSGMEAQPSEYQKELARLLSRYLDSNEWDEKLKGALENYQAKGKLSYVQDLMELLVEGGKPELAEIMQRSDEYLQRNILYLASDEAQHALEKAPDYLPAHRRLADILIREGRAQEAAYKINLVGNTYLMRGNLDKAADLFAEVIELWPADTDARRRVISMMRNQGRVAETLHHYAELADLHYRLRADIDKALEVYNEGLTYAREVNAEPRYAVPILKSLADIESQRLNWRKALQYLERAAEGDPNDDEVVRQIVNLYFQLGESKEAISVLDKFIRHCLENEDIEKVTSTLEDEVRRRPEEIPLRQRLAEVYRQQGRQQDAITQMDALGELQLDAGQLEAATATIRKIVEMGPPDVDGYRQLLEQLESGNRT